MFSVKDMCEHRLSNTAYPTKTEVDVQTGKKKTVINTDLFAIKEWTITCEEFIECYKGLMRVYEEVFPSSIFGDFCQYQCCLLLHEYFDHPNLFNVIVRFDSYICRTWLEPHGRFVMDSDDTFFIMDWFDHEVKEENDDKRLDAVDYTSGSHREDGHGFCTCRSASPPGMRFQSGNEWAPSSAHCILCTGGGHLAPHCMLHSAKCQFKNGDLTSKIDN
jgi:hypothetical protein